MARKYNPFKMWGAWVSAILFLILITIGTYFYIPMSDLIISVMLSIGGAVIFFIFGWGIHSLVRYLK